MRGENEYGTVAATESLVRFPLRIPFLCGALKSLTRHVNLRF